MAETPIFDRSDMILDRSVASALVSYSASSNGVDDSARINAFLSAKGANSTVQFDKRRQYRAGNTIQLLDGQTVTGLNVKRADKIQALVTNAVTVNGSTTSQLDVADASIFTVGSKVVVSYDPYHITAEVVIQGKVGNSLILANPLSVGVDSCYSATNPIGSVETSSWKQADGTTALGAVTGAYVTVSYKLVSVPAGAKFRGNIVDGNKDNWESGHKANILWWNHIEVFVGDTAMYGIAVDDNEIFNCAGEATAESGGTMNGSVPTASQDNAPFYFTYTGAVQWGTRYKDNRIWNCGGNGLHLSSVNGVRIVGNTIDHCNLNLGVRHQGGGIEFSYAGRHIHIEGNVVRRCWNGINDVYLNNHSSLKIAFNELIRNKRYAFYIFSGTSYSPSNIRIIGNLLIDNPIAINGVNSAIHGITASDNQIYGTVYIRNVKKSTWTGGFIDNTSLSPVEIVAGSNIVASAGAVTLPAGQYYGGGTRGATDNVRVYAVGDEVILTQVVAGVPVVSGISRITVVAGTATAPIYTLGSLDTSFSNLATNPVFIHSAKYRNNTVCSTAITSGVTTQITLRDPSLFEVDDHISVSQMSLGYATVNNTTDNGIACVRITELDYSTGVATLAAAITTNFALNAPGTGAAEIRVFRGPSESGIVESGGNSELGCVMIRDSDIDFSADVVGGVYGMALRVNCSGTRVHARFRDQRTTAIGGPQTAPSDCSVEGCDIRSHATYSVPNWCGIRNGYAALKYNTIRATSQVVSGSAGAGINQTLANFKIIGNDVVMAGTGYTYDFGANADNGVYPGNYGRNSGGTTGERIDAGATGNVGAITLIPA